jgi:glycosyltransferase involved in cell wall biosynthesis
MINAAHHPRVGYVLRSYPRLSQTFVLNEIRDLEQLGVQIHVFAVINPCEQIVQPGVADVMAPVRYLGASRWQDYVRQTMAHLIMMATLPRGYFVVLRYVHRRRDLDQGYTSASRIQCFLQAVYLAYLLRREKRRTGAAIDHLHAHFAHDPTLIALLVHMLTGISFSFTGHARDLYQIPPAILNERIAAAHHIVTCCAANVAYLDQVVPRTLRDKVRLIHHGVDLAAFQPVEHARDTADPPLLILSIGRLTKKKGFPDLICACRSLKSAGHRFQCAIYGDGPQRHELAALITRLDLDGDVQLCGARTQQELLPLFQHAAIFALTPFVTEDGDRDGIPNVLIEAMASGLPVVSTAVAGIPELVTDGYDGLLATPHDTEMIATLIGELLCDEPRRAQLGAAARQTAVERFDLRASARLMAEMFDSLSKQQGESW